MTRPASASGVGRIAIVGNAPGLGAGDGGRLAERIDGAARVVRFNNAPLWGSGAGRRTDVHYLVNCGGQAREWVEDRSFPLRPHVAAARSIVLPIHPGVADLFVPEAEKGEDGEPSEDGVNHADALTRRLERAERPVRVVPTEQYAACCRAIGIDVLRAGGPVPSTGFLALWLELTGQDNGGRIELYGFGFAGWEGHAWERERAFALAREAEGRLVWHRTAE